MHLFHGRDQVLSHDQVIQWTKAKIRVYSDSVLCLGKMNESKDVIVRWEGQVEECIMSLSCKELMGIDRETVEIEWNVLSGFSSLQILQKSQDDLRERNIELVEFTDLVIFTSMINDIDWTRKGNEGICFRITRNQGIREKMLAGTQDVSRSWRRKLFFTHLKENGTPQPLQMVNDSKIPVIQNSRVSVLESWKC